MDKTAQARYIEALERNINQLEERIARERNYYESMLDVYKRERTFTSASVFNIANAQKQACELASMEAQLEAFQMALGMFIRIEC